MGNKNNKDSDNSFSSITEVPTNNNNNILLHSEKDVAKHDINESGNNGSFKIKEVIEQEHKNKANYLKFQSKLPIPMFRKLIFNENPNHNLHHNMSINSFNVIPINQNTLNIRSDFDCLINKDIENQKENDNYNTSKNNPTLLYDKLQNIDVKEIVIDEKFLEQKHIIYSTQNSKYEHNVNAHNNNSNVDDSLKEIHLNSEYNNSITNTNASNYVQETVATEVMEEDSHINVLKNLVDSDNDRSLFHSEKKDDELNSSQNSDTSKITNVIDKVFNYDDVKSYASGFQKSSEKNKKTKQNSNKKRNKKDDNVFNFKDSHTESSSNSNLKNNIILINSLDESKSFNSDSENSTRNVKKKLKHKKSMNSNLNKNNKENKQSNIFKFDNKSYKSDSENDGPNSPNKSFFSLKYNAKTTNLSPSPKKLNNNSKHKNNQLEISVKDSKDFKTTNLSNVNTNKLNSNTRFKNLFPTHYTFKSNKHSESTIDPLFAKNLVLKVGSFNISKYTDSKQKIMNQEKQLVQKLKKPRCISESDLMKDLPKSNNYNENDNLQVIIKNNTLDAASIAQIFYTGGNFKSANADYFLLYESIQKLPFLKDIIDDKKTVNLLISKMKYCILEKDKTLSKEGCQPLYLFFLKKGVINEYRGGNLDKPIHTIKNQVFFGESSIINQTVRLETYKADEICYLYILNKSYIADLLKELNFNSYKDEKTQLIENNPILRNIKSVGLISNMLKFEYPYGEQVIRKGDFSLGLYIIHEGELEVRIPGGDKIRMKPGELMGTMYFFGSKYRTVDVYTSKASTVYYLSFNSLKSCVGDDFIRKFQNAYIKSKIDNNPFFLQVSDLLTNEILDHFELEVIPKEKSLIFKKNSPVNENLVVIIQGEMIDESKRSMNGIIGDLVMAEDVYYNRKRVFIKDLYSKFGNTIIATIPRCRLIYLLNDTFENIQDKVIKRKFIRSISFFKNLSDTVIEYISQLSQIEDYDADAVIIRKNKIDEKKRKNNNFSSSKSLFEKTKYGTNKLFFVIEGSVRNALEYLVTREKEDANIEIKSPTKKIKFLVNNNDNKNIKNYSSSKTNNLTINTNSKLDITDSNNSMSNTKEQTVIKISRRETLTLYNMNKLPKVIKKTSDNVDQNNTNNNNSTKDNDIENDKLKNEWGINTKQLQNSEGLNSDILYFYKHKQLVGFEWFLDKHKESNPSLIEEVDFKIISQNCINLSSHTKLLTIFHKDWERLFPTDTKLASYIQSKIIYSKLNNSLVSPQNIFIFIRNNVISKKRQSSASLKKDLAEEKNVKSRGKVKNNTINMTLKEIKGLGKNNVKSTERRKSKDSNSENQPVITKEISMQNKQIINIDNSVLEDGLVIIDEISKPFVSIKLYSKKIVEDEVLFNELCFFNEYYLHKDSKRDDNQMNMNINRIDSTKSENLFRMGSGLNIGNQDINDNENNIYNEGKVFNYDNYNKNEIEETNKRYENPFIPKLLYFFESEFYLVQIFERLQGKDLYTVLYLEDFHPNYEIACFWVACLLLAVKKLHDLDFLYRNIKPENILISDNGYPVLSRFEIVTLLHTHNRFKTSSVKGTPHYMAPEIILNSSGYSFSVDYWAIGVCLYESICKTFPFGNKLESPREVYSAVLNDELVFPSYVNNSEFTDAVKKMLNKNITDRAYSFEHIIALPFFSRINWEMLENMLVVSPYIPNNVKEKTYSFNNKAKNMIQLSEVMMNKQLIVNNYNNKTVKRRQSKVNTLMQKNSSIFKLPFNRTPLKLENKN